MSGNSGNLDFLRACAVLTVYFGHLLRANHVDNIGPIDVQSFAQTGVLIFFVHTCLVLLMSLERMEERGARRAFSFYVRRIFRIYPLSMLAVIFVVSVNVPRFFLAPKYEWFGWPTFFSNLALSQNLTLSHNLLIQLWSLPLEVQMYVLLPLIFYVLQKQRAAWVPFAMWLFAAVLAYWCIRLQTSDRLSLVRYAPCFLGGAVGYVLARRRCLRMPFWGWPLAIAATAGIRQLGFRAGWVACLLLGMAIPQFEEMKSKTLRTISAWIARYSYGIYLSHTIIFWFVMVILHSSPLAMKVGVCAVLSVACPVLLYHGIEKPMIAVGVRLSKMRSQESALAARFARAA